MTNDQYVEAIRAQVRAEGLQGQAAAREVARRVREIVNFRENAHNLPQPR